MTCCKQAACSVASVRGVVRSCSVLLSLPSEALQEGKEGGGEGRGDWELQDVREEWGGGH